MPRAEKAPAASLTETTDAHMSMLSRWRGQGRRFLYMEGEEFEFDKEMGLHN